jgi:hypothetical protein
MAEKPSLAELERLVAGRHPAEALPLALKILEAIDQRRGNLDYVATGPRYPGATEEDAAVVFATRFAAAFGRLMIEPDLQISRAMYEHLLAQHRWIELIFSLSGFRTSDNFVSLFATDAGSGQVRFGAANFLHFLIMRTMNSIFEIDLDCFWSIDPAASAVAFLNYISSRYVFSRRAFELRERLLEWLPARLANVKLGIVQLLRLPEVYMHCSYALTPKKHAIKRPLMEQVRRACLEAGVVEDMAPATERRGERMTVVVIADLFHERHANYRCFARSVQSLRGRFNLIGIISPDPIGTPIINFFDECIAMPTGDFFTAVRTAAAAIVARKPALIWYLGVGATQPIIALAALRLAPIQCASIGVNASTMSPMMDYFILPEDWVASQECFSEKLVPVPKVAMPFLRPAVTVQRHGSDDTTRVAIAASLMKFNPPLFDTIARISAEAKADVQFHFFLSPPGVLPHFEFARILRDRVPRSIVHRYSPYQQYMAGLGRCDLFLSPFPHGGMTTVMDMFQLGLPGVCLDGTESHAHADAAIFARINMPAELTTKSVDEYVAAATRLIDDKAWRHQCAEIVRSADIDKAFFKGDPALFCEAIENLIWPTNP